MKCIHYENVVPIILTIVLQKQIFHRMKSWLNITKIDFNFIICNIFLNLERICEESVVLVNGNNVVHLRFSSPTYPWMRIYQNPASTARPNL
jgi:hypothetical protein